MRARFIIDPDGVVQAIETLTPPVGRRIAETIHQLWPFHVMRASKGTQATPVGWTPGQPTLKPGPDLVGLGAEALSARRARTTNAEQPEVLALPPPRPPRFERPRHLATPLPAPPTRVY